MNDKLKTPTNYIKARFPGKIITVTNDGEVSSALSLFLDQQIIGFDTETKPSFKKGEYHHVSLLQLATEDFAILFRLQFLKNFLPIQQFFEKETVLKAGVAIRDDIRALQKLFPFTPLGFIELADIAKKKGLKNFGLKGMSEEVLNLTLSKKAKLSNWEASDLKLEQLQYAATDAWIGRKIFEKLQSL